MYKVKDLSEAEKKEIGYNKSEAGLRNSISASIAPKNNNSIGIGSILVIIGAISAIAIASVVVVRKKLSKKIKK